MKNLFVFRGFGVSLISAFVFVVLISFTVKGQNRGIFVDPRDGYQYWWVKVGGQTWMTHNLMFKDPANSWTYNGDDTLNILKYGRMYNWEGARVSCPRGWKLPSDKDWNKLIEHYGADIAGKMVQAWDSVGTEEGLSQISSLFSGIRYTNGVFLNQTYWGACWSSTALNDSTAVNYLFARGAKSIAPSSNDKRSGFSVRCIKK